jgi:hypothetical protein
LFAGLAAAYVGLDYWMWAMRVGDRRAVHWSLCAFGIVTVNLLLLPVSFDVMAKGAAFLVKRRTVGAAWYRPMTHLPVSSGPVVLHGIATIASTVPEIMVYGLLVGSSTEFIRNLIRCWTEKTPLVILYAMYAAPLTFLACLSTVYRLIPWDEAIGWFAAFAAASLLSVYVARFLGAPER